MCRGRYGLIWEQIGDGWADVGLVGGQVGDGQAYFGLDGGQDGRWRGR